MSNTEPLSEPTGPGLDRSLVPLHAEPNTDDLGEQDSLVLSHANGEWQLWFTAQDKKRKWKRSESSHSPRVEDIGCEINTVILTSTLDRRSSEWLREEDEGRDFEGEGKPS